MNFFVFLFFEFFLFFFEFFFLPFFFIYKNCRLWSNKSYMAIGVINKYRRKNEFLLFFSLPLRVRSRDDIFDDGFGSAVVGR